MTAKKIYLELHNKRMGNTYTKPVVLNGQNIVSISTKYLIYLNNNKHEVYLLAEDLIEEGNKIIFENKGKDVDIHMDVHDQIIYFIGEPLSHGGYMSCKVSPATLGYIVDKKIDGQKDIFGIA